MRASQSSGVGEGAEGTVVNMAAALQLGAGRVSDNLRSLPERTPFSTKPREPHPEGEWASVFS